MKAQVIENKQDEQPTITVIIPVYNDAIRLDKCLAAIAKQKYDLSLIDVRVVDNNSEQDIAKVVANYSFAKYLKETKPGSYVARNKALAAITSDLIAFTDSDCIPSKTWLCAAVDFLNNNTDYDAVGGKIELFAHSTAPNLCEYYDIVIGFDQKNYIENEGFSVTANLIVKNNVLTKTGFFNSELMSSGDKEWCRRIVSKGFKLGYSHNAIVMHPARDNSKSILTKLRRLLGGFYYQHKNQTPDKRFSLFSLLVGCLPPITKLKKIRNSSVEPSPFSFVGLILLFYFVQLYSVFYRIKLMVLRESEPERL
jgi:cellulose synthase/poly-beta-1,6-N-acetylglucosamine synthase-like glycosyltransferase